MDAFATNTHCMDRTTLLAQVSSASSLNQISSLIVAVREWLSAHPEDSEMRDVLEGLARTERAYFAPSSFGRSS
jgi:hypothetical protein